MKIPGIYVEIRGDHTMLKHDLARAKGEVKQLAGEMSNSLNNALTPGEVTSGMSRLTGALATASRAAKASQQDFKQYGEQVKHLAPLVGMTEKEFAGLQSRMLQFKTQTRADRMFADIQRATGMTNKELAVLRKRMGDAAGAARVLAAENKKVAGGMTAMLGSFSGMFTGIALFYGAKNLARGVLDTTIQIQGMEVALQAVLGSASASRREMDWLRKTVKDLGIDLLSTGEAFKLLSASAMGTTISQETVRGTFTAVSQSAVVLGLTAEDTRLVLLALSQMISKGTVYSEELRRQMGDRLPGAFSIAARAMETNTRELSRMLQRGEILTDEFLPKFQRVMEETYGAAARETDLIVQAQNRLKTAWTNLLTINPENRSGVLAFLKEVTGAVEYLDGQVKQVVDAFGVLSRLLTAPLKDLPAVYRELRDERREAEDPAAEMRRQALAALAAQSQRTSMVLGEMGDYTQNLEKYRYQKIEDEFARHSNALNRLRKTGVVNAQTYNDQLADLIAVRAAAMESMSKKTEKAIKKETDNWLSYGELMKRTAKIRATNDGGLSDVLADTEKARKLNEEYASLRATMRGMDSADWGAGQAAGILQQIEDMQEASKGFAAGWLDGMQRVVDGTDNGFEAMRSLAETTGQAMGDSIGGFLDEVTFNGTNMLDALSDAAVNLLKSIGSAINQMIGQQIASSLFSTASGLWASNPSGSGIAADTSTVRGYDASGNWMYAKGGVLAGPGISELSGGVYNRPTYFGYDAQVRPFAKGGVLGEAGPEAVMPLTRGKDGKLGVKTEGEAAPTVVQNFNLSPGVPEAVQREVRRAMPYIQAQTISALDERNQRGRRK